MSNVAQRVLRQRGFVPALITALGVLVVRLLQDAVPTVVGQLAYVGSVDQLSFLVGQVLGYDLPYAVGVLFALWVIAPIGGALNLAHVVARGLLASATGAVLLLVVQFVYSLVAQVVALGLNLVGFGALDQLLQAFVSAVGAFFSLTPLVLLAVLMLWLWHSRRPDRDAAPGLIDEV